MRFVFSSHLFQTRLVRNLVKFVIDKKGEVKIPKQTQHKIVSISIVWLYSILTLLYSILSKMSLMSLEHKLYHIVWYIYWLLSLHWQIHFKCFHQMHWHKFNFLDSIMRMLLTSYKPLKDMFEINIPSKFCKRRQILRSNSILGNRLFAIDKMCT